MDFNNKFDKQFENTGTSPSDSFFESTGGFKGKLKPPAQWFNWFWSKVIAAITELQAKLSAVDTDKANITLDNVNNSDFKTKVENSGYVGGAKNLIDGTSVDSLRTSSSSEEDSEYTMGNCAFAEGINTKASGQASHAEGAWSVASGMYSHAEGRNSTSESEASHVEGYSTKASGMYSHSEGRGTVASGISAHAEGHLCEARQQAAHAEGYWTIVKGSAGHAEGMCTIAKANQHVQGKYNIEDTTGKYAHIVGNGTGDEDSLARVDELCSNAHTLDWDGNAWYAGDVSTGADGLRLSKVLYLKFPEIKLEAKATKDYTTSIIITPSKYLLIRLKDGNTAGLTCVSGVSSYTYTGSNFSVQFNSDGTIHFYNSGSSSLTISNLEFLVIEKTSLTVSEK